MHTHTYRHTHWHGIRCPTRRPSHIHTYHEKREHLTLYLELWELGACKLHLSCMYVLPDITNKCVYVECAHQRSLKMAGLHYMHPCLTACLFVVVCLCFCCVLLSLFVWNIDVNFYRRHFPKIYRMIYKSSWRQTEIHWFSQFGFILILQTQEW